uniref:Uncharacterized protein n=1 Tax=Rhinella marina erythrocytic-like virus TaxID=2859906 RepID=A0A8F6YHY6_9VIRU|nr:hypothetical protein RMELV048 [Rhinella marina erythrocytic-like virus]
MYTDDIYVSNKMDNKKTGNILRAMKKKPKPAAQHVKKHRAVKQQVAQRVAQIQANEASVSAHIKSPFWRKIFALRGLSAEALNEGYINLIMTLQDDLRKAQNRYEKNKDSLQESEKYTVVKDKIERKINVIKTLRFNMAMRDHIDFLENQDLAYVQKIPMENVKSFLAKRTAIPIIGINRDIVGNLSQRKNIRDYVRRKRKQCEKPETQAKIICLDNKGVPIDNTNNPMNQACAAATRYSNKELGGVAGRMSYSTVPWFKDGKPKGLMTRENVEERDGKYYLDSVPIPKAFVVKQDGDYWVRVKKTWLDHVSIHGRPFIENKVGYLLQDNTVYIETEQDYSDSVLFMTERTTKQGGNVKDLFIGISNDFSGKLLKESGSVDKIAKFMATLDPSISNSKIHRNRFYSEHYKAKIIHLSANEIFPEIFSNPEITQDQKNIVIRQLANAENRVKKFLTTGTYAKQGPNIPIKLPIQDISANPNAFWYLNKKKELSIGDLTDLPTDVHKLSKPYIETLIMVENVDVGNNDIDLEQVFDNIKRPNLLANGLFSELNRYLDRLMGNYITEDTIKDNSRRARLQAGKNIKRYYDTLNA